MTDAADAILLNVPMPAIREALADQPVIHSQDILGLPEDERRRVRVVVTGGVNRIAAPEMDALPNLGLIVTIGAGFDGIDADEAARRGIGIGTGVGVNAEAVADLAAALFLAAARSIIPNDARVRTGNWVWRDMRLVKTVSSYAAGIVGMGSIGQAIAHRVAAFGCPIAWAGPRPKPEIAYERAADVLDLARRSDVLFVAAPLNAASAGMISREVIEALGPEGLLVNVGRGGLVDEDALIAALKDGRLGGAALDVFAQEPTPAERWADVPNVVFSPHTGGLTHEAMAGMRALAAQRARDFLRQAPPRKV